ncbi:MAG: polymer-forming cytoskeletal protein [Planctomycetota bacterium]
MSTTTSTTVSDEITVIGPDTRIKGEMEFERGAQILGRFDGKITSGGEVQIGAGAECAASIQAERITIDGQIKGDLNANQQLTLSANAVVAGDITAGTLVVTEGASFVGSCRVGPAAQQIENDTLATSAIEADAELTPPWKRGTTVEPTPEVQTTGRAITILDTHEPTTLEQVAAETQPGGLGTESVASEDVA